jgi:hypothetical protein
MATGIYKIVNIKNDKFYIGSSARLNARKAEHRYRTKNRRGNSIIRNAILKYGEENFKFEIIEEFLFDNFASKEYINELLSSREQFYIDTLHPEYNIRIKDVTRSIDVCSEKQHEHLKRISKLPKSAIAYRKPIYQLDKLGNVVKEFRCAKDAERELNLYCGSVYRVLNGEYSHTKNYYFKLKKLKTMSTKVERLYATCKKCGTNVGCGCHLVDGVCAACRTKTNK